jgi:hypothetical protein
MSRLIEKLKRQRQIEPQPMGFAAFGRPAPEKSRMQLLVYLTADNQEGYADLIVSADAVLVAVNKPEDLKSIEKVCQAKEGILAGGWVRFSDAAALQQTTETSSCDFAAFSSGTLVTVTRNEKLGRILELDPDLDDGILRTVNDLPVDAVLISAVWPEKALTLNRLMHIRRLVSLINKPLLVCIPEDLTQIDLQSLWDMGVSGVVAGPVDAAFAGKLAALRSQIDKLTLPSLRKKERASPILPHIQPEKGALPDDGEEEEEEEDE